MQFTRLLQRFATAAQIFREEGIAGILDTLERMRLASKKSHDLTVILSFDSLQDRFTEINKRGYWFSRANMESRSGEGSTKAFTKTYLSELTVFLDGLEKDVDKEIIFFDAPCGDFNWIGPIASRKKIHYIGGDIVPEIIAKNKRDIAGPNINFIDFDITVSRFPAATIWHCRDCLIHLSFSNIKKCLENFASSNVEYALLTSHYLPDEVENVDISDGDFRALDLRKPPFQLPPPVSRIPDSSGKSKIQRFTHVYTRAQIIEWLT